MLSGSKLYGEGALFGSVPDFSPHSRMKLADSLDRFVAHGTSPVACQLAGMYRVFVAADADGMRFGTNVAAAPSTTSAPTADKCRFHLVIEFLHSPATRRRCSGGSCKTSTRRP